MNHSLVLPVRHLALTDRKGDAVGRASGQSPFLGDPEAKFCWGKRGPRQNRQERSSMPIRPLSALVAKTAHSLTSAYLFSGERAGSSPRLGVCADGAIVRRTRSLAGAADDRSVGY